MIYTCNVRCKTHDKLCFCSCEPPHQLRKTKNGEIIRNGCYKENPFKEEESLHYHTDCEFDSNGISLTEKIIETKTYDEECPICGKKVVYDLNSHLKYYHSWML